ncbi:MAG: cadherin-like beta sandwich domain-containing protein, partial [Acidimicrobiales bacterium]
FADAGGVSDADYIAKWDGSSWSALGADSGGDGVLDGPVYSLAKLSTKGIAVGGMFAYNDTTKANALLRWDGGQWQTDVATVSCSGNDYYRLSSLDEVVDISASADTFWAVGRIGGGFKCSGGMPTNAFSYLNVAKWDGSNLVEVSSPYSYDNYPTDVEMMADGSVYTGLSYKCSGYSGCNWSAANKNTLVRKWDSGTWSTLSWDVVAPSGSFSMGPPERMGVFDLAEDGSGNLLVGGYFADAGGVSDADYIAKWDGSNWTSPGVIPYDNYGVTGVTDILVSGTNLYVAGVFGNRPLWSWSSATGEFRPVGNFALGSNIGHQALAKSGSTVYLASRFTDLDGVSGATGVAKVSLSATSTLGSLSPSAGTLSPSFASGTTSYTLPIAEGTCSVTFTLENSNGSAGSSYTVNGGTVSLVPRSGEIVLNLLKGQATTLAVSVRSGDMSSSTTYSIVVTRAGSPAAPTASLSPISAGVTSATLAYTVTTNGHGVSHRVRWGTSTGTYTSQTGASQFGCSSATLDGNATLSGLSASTTYYYVVEMTRSLDSSTVTTAEQTFTTEAGGRASVASVSGITTSAATLNLELNPLGQWDSYQLQYSTDVTYGTCGLPGNPWECKTQIPNGGSMTTSNVAVTLSGLSSGTVYNYRLQVRNWSPTALRSVTGTFTTLSVADTTVPPTTSLPPATVAPQVDNTVSPPATSTPATSPPATAAPAPVAPSPTTKKAVTAAAIAKYAGLTVASGSRVTLKVAASSAKNCKATVTSVKGLKKGSCRVTVTVTPKKGKATSRTVTLTVTG